MSAVFKRILLLIRRGDLRISEHGYDEIAEESLVVRDLLASIEDAVVVEEYPEYGKGPCVLVLQKDAHGNGIHAVWGIPRGADLPAVLITAYRPDPDLWMEDLLRRKK